MLRVWLEATPYERINLLVGFAIIALLLFVINSTCEPVYHNKWNWHMSAAFACFWIFVASAFTEIRLYWMGKTK